MQDPKEFVEKLRHAVNYCSAERFAGDTPDFIVAELLFHVAESFGNAVRARQEFSNHDALRESAAHRLTETNRCLRVVDDIIAAALVRRPDHHAVSWLHAARTAIVDGLDPAAATAGINDAANASEANHG